MGPLRIHTREVIASDGTTARRTFVHCPSADGWVPLEACRQCGHWLDARPIDPGERGEQSVCCARATRRRRGSARKLAAETPVAALMDPLVLCVSQELPLEVAARRLREDDKDVAVVVDRDQRPIGMLTRADVVGIDDESTKTVREAMTPYVTTLLEGASVAEALALMVDRGLHHVPVLSAGRVMGVASPERALAWLVRALGPRSVAFADTEVERPLRDDE